MATTTTRWGLDRAETATTAVAAAVSGGCYLAFDGPYLARGVAGDCVGFAVLGVPLLASGRRARHEALVCLAGIGAVHLAGADWPLALPEPAWWLVFVAAFGAYLWLRRRVTAAAARTGGSTARPRA